MSEEVIAKTAIVFLADGFEEVEALTVVDYLRRAGVNVLTVAVPSDTMKRDNIVTSSHKVTMYADLSFKQFEKDFDERTADLVYTPGGMPGSINLSKCERVLSFITECFEKNKVVAAICAAPALVLSKTKVLTGKKWTCFPNMEDDADSTGTAGSTHLCDVPFVTDGNVVTGRGAGCTEQLAMELVRLLCGSEVAQKLKTKTVQR